MSRKYDKRLKASVVYDICELGKSTSNTVYMTISSYFPFTCFEDTKIEQIPSRVSSVVFYSS